MHGPKAQGIFKYINNDITKWFAHKNTQFTINMYIIYTNIFVQILHVYKQVIWILDLRNKKKYYILIRKV